MSARCPQLPFLPGFTFNSLLGRTNFHMNPKFDFIAKGVPALVEKVKPNMLGCLSDRYPSLYPRGEYPEIPTWIAYDKQILRFDAFFKETLQEFRNAPFQIRKVVIYFFLEDGTIQVIEPKIDNSGVMQGTVIARQRIRFPAPMDANFYDIIDLNVGYEVEFYGRVFKITNCDKFTRVFLNRCGIAIPDPIAFPEDPYYEKRKHESEAFLPKKPSRKVNPLQQFLANDRKVLRFYGYWDDQETDFGYLHNLEIHFYLADDTIDIKENTVDNSGHDSSFQFLRRSKLPKVYKGLPGPGADVPLTILNVLGAGLSCRYVADVLDCGKEDVKYYGEQDFAIGAMLNVFGRRVVLTNCDSYTKEYYRVKYGIDNFKPIEMPEDIGGGSCKVEQKHEYELPPWNGYGTFEDSAQNCRTVVPKLPHQDYQKFLKNDKVGLDSHVLRFEARMLSKIPENCTRIFIISYFLADDSITVNELARQNSGFTTSLMFKKSVISLPGQTVFTSKPPDCYKPQHMFVGATIVINSFKFVLINVDEYALRYMELHDHEYPKSNIKIIMDKIRKVLEPVYKDFVAENMPKETPVLSYEKLRAKLCQIMGENFTEHEMITISRAFSANCVEEKFNREAIRALTLTELKRYLWDDLIRLREYFLKRDECKSGVLPRTEVYFLLKACRVPLDKTLIERILNVIKQDSSSNLYYNDLLDFLDRTKCPLADTVPINVKHELTLTAEPEPEAGKLIDWCAFNRYLDLEKTFNDVIGEDGLNSLQKNKH